MDGRTYKLVPQPRISPLKEFRASRNSFTLVELMVVVAIIAMLAGLMAMYIHDARGRARATHCRNNLRQFGIAIGKYASDWNGYFIQPGYTRLYAGGTYISSGSGGKTREVGEFSFAPYGGRIGEGGDLEGYVWSDSYANFIGNYVRSATTTKDVTYCPEVDMTIFTNTSRAFKGLYFDSINGYQRDTTGEMTTYAINGNAVFQLRSALKDCAFAFIDWNAEQGWLSWPGATAITGFNPTNLTLPAIASWYMAKETVGTAVRQTVYKDAGYGGSHPAKKDVAYRTEIGYHHRSGTNLIAHYVAMDGHVGSISSNATQAEFSRLFLGQ